MNQPEHVDVLIVGAGISGIDAAYHLQTNCPDKTYTILEGREDLGGTWDLFRYPGIRSDSDMHTLGFGFKPWVAEKSIADGPAILDYLRETAEENHITQRIRFGHLVTMAEWSSRDSTWTVTATHVDTDDTVTLTCGYLFMCSGYYSYKGGYSPDFPGQDRFGGRIIHPQQWPEDLDYTDKRVVVIGSGATAMTLVPAMSSSVQHITMLQRSPTYVAARPDTDSVANLLRKVLPDKAAYGLTRWKNVKMQQLIYRKTRTDPEKVRERLIGMVREELGPDYDVERHFQPSYDPWDQRLCLIANGDLFAAIRNGKASVVTDQISSFTESGIALESGTELEADIIITATGLEIVTLGEVDFTIDGEPVDFSKTWSYMGLAFSDVPNLASTFGYVNASWTLRADLVCDFVCRLLNHMTETETTQCTPRLRPSDRDMTPRPWIDDFSAGYIKRALGAMPRQGDRAPWLNTQDYAKDKKMMRKSPVDDGVMQFTCADAIATAGV